MARGVAVPALRLVEPGAHLELHEHLVERGVTRSRKPSRGTRVRSVGGRPVDPRRDRVVTAEEVHRALPLRGRVPQELDEGQRPLEASAVGGDLVQRVGARGRRVVIASRRCDGEALEPLREGEVVHARGSVTSTRARPSRSRRRRADTRARHPASPFRRHRARARLNGAERRGDHAAVQARDRITTASNCASSRLQRRAWRAAGAHRGRSAVTAGGGGTAAAAERHFVTTSSRSLRREPVHTAERRHVEAVDHPRRP